jgi:hypothetical protein
VVNKKIVHGWGGEEKRWRRRGEEMCVDLVCGRVAGLVGSIILIDNFV